MANKYICEYGSDHKSSLDRWGWADKVPKKRVTCPVCKRRMLGRAIIHDGEVLNYVVPRHKKKKWWKKQN